MLASEAQLVVVDFESTGSIGELPSEPWQIGMVWFDRGRAVPERRFCSLLRIGDRPFNPYAPGRHAVLRQELRAAPLLAELWRDLSRWLEGRALAGHSVATERKFLEEAFPLHGLGPWVDTLELSRIAYPRAPSHGLEDLLDLLHLRRTVDEACPGLQPHDALFDAVACAALLEHLLGLPHWQNVSLEELSRARAVRNRPRSRVTGLRRPRDG
ncbi:MAG: 3'-5' exonuclease, partial [Lentisphaeria bacterium]|nr:3'-5' exonuclease [Lentisphaeria bacterium]